MELDALILADAVTTTDDGKFYIHGGGFTRYEVAALGAPIPIAVLVRFRVEKGDEEKEHLFQLALIGPTGVPNVAPIEIQAVPPQKMPDLLEGEEQFLQIASQIQAFALRDGLYHLELHYNGKLVRRIPMPVVVAGPDQADLDMERPKAEGPTSKRSTRPSKKRVPSTAKKPKKARRRR